MKIRAIDKIQARQAERKIYNFLWSIVVRGKLFELSHVFFVKLLMFLPKTICENWQIFTIEDICARLLSEEPDDQRVYAHACETSLRKSEAEGNEKSMVNEKLGSSRN